MPRKAAQSGAPPWPRYAKLCPASRFRGSASLCLARALLCYALPLLRYAKRGTAPPLQGFAMLRLCCALPGCAVHRIAFAVLCWALPSSPRAASPTLRHALLCRRRALISIAFAAIRLCCALLRHAQPTPCPAPLNRALAMPSELYVAQPSLIIKSHPI